jgi:hypothetical protein
MFLSPSLSLNHPACQWDAHVGTSHMLDFKRPGRGRGRDESGSHHCLLRAGRSPSARQTVWHYVSSVISPGSGQVVVPDTTQPKAGIYSQRVEELAEPIKSEMSSSSNKIDSPDEVVASWDGEMELRGRRARSAVVAVRVIARKPKWRSMTTAKSRRELLLREAPKVSRTPVNQEPCKRWLGKMSCTKEY